MNNRQSGFTLIELVVVIVILAALAAIALPRYINLGTEARIASVNGVAGGLRAAVAVVQARYIANGNNAAVTVTMLDGTVVGVNAITGIPLGTAAGIGSALQAGAAATPVDGFTTSYAAPLAVTFRITPPNTANCQASYNGTTGAVTTNVTVC
jgi:MSHA pilin protein MshA